MRQSPVAGCRGADPHRAGRRRRRPGHARPCSIGCVRLPNNAGAGEVLKTGARMTRSWSVARTHAHKEILASTALGQQGYGVVCPMTLKTVRRSRRLVDRRVPLFPGYVFIALEGAPEGWRAINSTRGVRSLLTTAEGRPSRLPTGFVEDVLARTADDGVVVSRADLTPGQRVRIRSGAFADLVGQVAELDPPGRVRVLLTLMAREVRVSVPATVVERAVWVQ